MTSKLTSHFNSILLMVLGAGHKPLPFNDIRLNINQSKTTDCEQYSRFRDYMLSIYLSINL